VHGEARHVAGAISDDGGVADAFTADVNSSSTAAAASAEP
jgi:hypothetical protein